MVDWTSGKSQTSSKRYRHDISDILSEATVSKDANQTLAYALDYLCLIYCIKILHKKNENGDGTIFYFIVSFVW